MAQVGRISGPLLQANLLRNGFDLAFETDLIYLDVNSGRVGVKTNSPSNELQNTQTTRTTNLIVDTQADFTNIINIQGSSIQPFPGSLFLDSENVITANRVKTDDLLLDDDRISTYTANTNIELRPNGTGRTEFFNLWVENNFNITGDVRLDGNITFGNADTDSVTFDADVTSDILPDQDLTYNLGSPSKRWQTIESRLLNVQDINAQSVILAGVDLGTRQGNLYYVATNGDNANVGDHQQGPWRTLDYAVTQASAGDTIYLFPGVYEETCPITVPAGVTIVGENIRNTIIKPVSSDNYVDIFLLNGETTVSNLTVTDFYYDSINNVGHAFRFANGSTITTRSPYIQNVTVSTKGSVTSASDPRGFAQGDAGKGALVDGASVNGSSEEASMLFHAATFITPGVDALTMTNGVRVEWLNSFTYFANRGLYAVDGVIGHLSSDGSTIKYGAELRSIGSANVYGNYGAVADGLDTLMYLIQHNVGYIGSGKFSDNDPSRVIQANEIVKLNSGRIYYQTVNHFGDFRIGENFFINQQTGESSIVITEGEVQGFGRLRVTSTDTGNITIIDGEQVSTGNIIFTGNLTQSVAGDYNIDSASGTTNLDSNVSILKDLDITGNLSFDGSLNLLGNQSSDTLKFNVDIDQNFNPNTDSTFDLGSITKEWKNIWLSSSSIGDTYIQDNYITTDLSNANLEIRANGTGNIYVPTNNLHIQNNLTVDGLFSIQNYNVTGDIDLTGNSSAGSNASISNDFTITQNLTVGSDAQFEEINIAGNVVTTSTSNTDLELRANGTGIVLIPNSAVNIVNNLSVDNIFNNNNVNITLQTEFGLADVSDIDISGNYIETNNGNLDLVLSAIGNVVIPANDVSFEQDLTVGTLTDLQSTNISGLLDHTGAYNQTGNYDIAGELTVDNVYIEDNFITTTSGNLILSATGDINVDTNDVEIANNLTVSGDTDLQSTVVTGTLNQTGDRTQVGDYTQTGNLDVDGKFTSDRYVQFTDININDNIITTTIGNNDLDLRAAGTGVVRILNPVVVSNNLFASTIDVGDINIANDLVLDDIVVRNSNIQINDNYITTNISNSDLELRATGDVVVRSNNVIFDQNLTVNGLTDIDDLTIVGDVTQTGNTSQTGNVNLTGNITISGDYTIADQPFQFEDILIDGNVVTTTLSNSNLDLRANGTGIVLVPDNNVNIVNNLTVNDATVKDIVINNSFALENMVSSTDIEIFDNVIRTTNSNSNLELRTSGSGKIRLQDSLFLGNTLSTDELAIQFTNPNTIIDATGSLKLPVGSNLTRVESIPEEIVDGGAAPDTLLIVYDGGNAVTVFGPNDLILNAGVALTPEGNSGDIRFNTTYNLFEGFSQTDQFFGGVFSQDARTRVFANTNDQIVFNVNNNQVALVDSTKLTVTGLDVNSISIRNNLISTNNIDLQLVPNGTGRIVVSNFIVDDNKFINASTTNLSIASTGFGYTKIPGTHGYVIPVGDESNKGTTPQIGEIRWNTELEIQEVYNGTEWIASRGIVDNVTAAEMGVIVDEWTLILG